jgi:hypothetical protein
MIQWFVLFRPRFSECFCIRDVGSTVLCCDVGGLLNSVACVRLTHGIVCVEEAYFILVCR